MWEENQTKIYKVASFPNSDGEQFGVTIKGKGRHVDSHNKVMETINRLPKDKATSFGDVRLTVTDKVKTNTLLNAKITITSKENIEGQVELKIHKPSDRRQKATIEIRRLNGHTYEAVESVKELITDMLDKFHAGENVSKVLIKAKSKAKGYSPMVRQPSLAVKLLSCAECDFKAKTMVTLRNHIIKNHKSPKNRCDICGFECNTDDMKEHMDQFHIVHQSIKKQNQLKRKKSVVGCDECGVTADNQKKLKEHKLLQHPVKEDTSSASEPSPPRKKQEKQIKVKIDNGKEVEISDIETNKVETKEVSDKVEEAMEEDDTQLNLNKDSIIKAQEQMIKDQAKDILGLKEDVNILHDAIARSKKTQNKVTLEMKPVPKFLTPVQAQHLKDLEGFRMKSNGNPGGDCLSSCTTMHLSFTKDKSERNRVNMKINHHIADSFDTYYCNKISLP